MDYRNLWHPGETDTKWNLLRSVMATERTGSWKYPAQMEEIWDGEEAEIMDPKYYKFYSFASFLGQSSLQPVQLKKQAPCDGCW